VEEGNQKKEPERAPHEKDQAPLKMEEGTMSQGRWMTSTRWKVKERNSSVKPPEKVHPTDTLIVAL